MAVLRLRFEIWFSYSSNSPVIHVHCKADWNEEHRTLRVGAETTIRVPYARYEIQYGTVDRPPHMNTSWNEARFQVSAQRFADLPELEGGLALLNDRKYGYRIIGSTIDLALLRWPKSPDPNADIGVQEFSFGYFPHRGLRDIDHILQQAHEMNAPVLVGRSSRAAGTPATQLEPFAAGNGTGSGCWFSVDGDRVKLELVKNAEDGEGVIVRLYEFAGSTSRVRVYVPGNLASASETDRLENNLNQIKLSDGVLDPVFKLYEIRTFRLT